MKQNIYSTLDVRVRAVRAVLAGGSVAKTAQAYQVHPVTLHRWLVRRRKKGEAGLQRKAVSGRPRIINQQLMARISRVIMQPASKYGFETDFWTCRRIIRIIFEHFHMRVSQPTMWRVLRALDLTYQKPDRKYNEGSDRIRAKWIREEVPLILQCVKRHRGILYFEDESNISLTAALGKTWSPRGKQPVANVTGRRGGVAAMSAISRTGNLAFTLWEKRISSNEVIRFLEQLLVEHPRRHLVVVMDRAPVHTSGKTMKFIEQQRRLHVFYLPKYSPKFNPDEYVWNHLKHQELKWHQAKTKDELKSLATKKLNKMSRDSSLIRGLWFRCCIAELMN